MTQPWPADHVERWPLERLVPYARNARTHSAPRSTRSRPRCASGAGPTRCWSTRTGMIIAGHGRVEAARKLGLAEAPVMVATGWSEAKKRAYVIADNKLALNAGWDEAMLAAELADLQEMAFDLDLIGFDAAELGQLLGGDEQVDGENDVPDTPADPVSQGRGSVGAGQPPPAVRGCDVRGGRRAPAWRRAPAPDGHRPAIWCRVRSGVAQRRGRIADPPHRQGDERRPCGLARSLGAVPGRRRLRLARCPARRHGGRQPRPQPGSRSGARSSGPRSGWFSPVVTTTGSTSPAGMR